MFSFQTVPEEDFSRLTSDNKFHFFRDKMQGDNSSLIFELSDLLHELLLAWFRQLVNINTTWVISPNKEIIFYPIHQHNLNIVGIWSHECSNGLQFSSLIVFINNHIPLIQCDNKLIILILAVQASNLGIQFHGIHEDSASSIRYVQSTIRGWAV